VYKLVRIQKRFSAKILTASPNTDINRSKQTHLFTGAAARRANPSQGGSAKPKGLPTRKIAGLPNRVAVLLGKHP
jgi:hypothetical protein